MPYDLADALKLLQSGRIITSLEVIKFNDKKKTAGDVIRYGRCKIARNQPKHSKAHTLQTSQGSVKLRNANHAFHFTRNIQLASGAIRTIHPLFITAINGIQLI